MKPWRHPAVLAAYEHLPHARIDAAVARLMRRERPRWLVRALIRAWIHRGRIAMHDFEPGPFATVERFFLRRLRPGARPLAAAGLVMPVDGTVVDVGVGRLAVKGHVVSLPALCGCDASDPAVPTGAALVVFLSPDGYHHVHAPGDARVLAVTPLPGRTFPQNADALAARPDVWIRNARVVVRTDRYTLVLVAASLVSQIEVDVAPGDRLVRGAPLGRFTFGSTIVLLLPEAVPLAVQVGDPVRLGQRVTAAPDPD